MIRNKGFALIEIIVAVEILMIITISAIGLLMGGKLDNMRVRCTDGYKFVYTDTGDMRQLMNDQGKGVKCQQ
jgi:type II secretory pathway pseudopilin PulG